MCPLACLAVRGDDARYIFFCPMLDGVFAARRDWVRPGWLAGGDMTMLLMLVPTDDEYTIAHGVWLYVVCRA